MAINEDHDEIVDLTIKVFIAVVLLVVGFLVVGYVFNFANLLVRLVMFFAKIAVFSGLGYVIWRAVFGRSIKE